MAGVVKFSHMQDPTSWEPNGPDRGCDIITCVTPADAKKAADLMNRLQDRAFKAEVENDRYIDALSAIAFMGMSAPRAMATEGLEWYRDRAHKAIGTAARALDAAPQDRKDSQGSGSARPPADAAQKLLAALIYQMNEAVLDTDASARPTGDLVDVWRMLKKAVEASMNDSSTRGSTK